MALELILQDIELSDNTINDNTINDNTFDIWYSNRLQKFVANENVAKGRRFIYELTDTEENISKTHRQEILEYRLGKVTPNDVVTIGDIFMHSKFIEKIL